MGADEGAGADGLALALVRALMESGLTVGTAESCTGGRIAAAITGIAGSSEVFLGGIVAYSNGIKERVLGVSADTLIAHGAVSPETAREMALGAQARLGVDLAVSVTGIAGPGGGTMEKPVGLVYLGFTGPDDTRIEKHIFKGGRSEVQEQGTIAALNGLLGMIRA